MSDLRTAERQPREATRRGAGHVIWITGLSAAGKSTVAAEVVRLLRAADVACIALDGDDLRELFGRSDHSGEDFKRAGRMALGFKYARLCGLLAAQGATVVIPTISLHREIHEWNRANLPGYFEVYLKVPVEELRRRDPKGIYRRFDSGELQDVAGLDLEVDEPRAPDLLIEYAPAQTAEIIARRVVDQFLGMSSKQKAKLEAERA